MATPFERATTVTTHPLFRTGVASYMEATRCVWSLRLRQCSVLHCNLVRRPAIRAQLVSETTVNFSRIFVGPVHVVCSVLSKWLQWTGLVLVGGAERCGQSQIQP